MHAFTRVELTRREQPDELIFTTQRHDGWVELYALPAFALLVVFMFWLESTLITRTIAVGAGFVVCASTLALWLQGRQATLRVSADQIVAQGNLGRWFRTMIRISVSSRLSVLYCSGQEGEHSGVYVRYRWRRVCLLPRIDKVQGEAILTAIHAHFPAISIVAAQFSIPLHKRVLTSLYPPRSRSQHISR